MNSHKKGFWLSHLREARAALPTSFAAFWTSSKIVPQRRRPGKRFVRIFLLGKSVRKVSLWHTFPLGIESIYTQHKLGYDRQFVNVASIKDVHSVTDKNGLMRNFKWDDMVKLSELILWFRFLLQLLNFWNYCILQPVCFSFFFKVSRRNRTHSRDDFGEDLLSIFGVAGLRFRFWVVCGPRCGVHHVVESSRGGALSKLLRVVAMDSSEL